MKEFLFIIWDINSDTAKFIKVTAINDNEARNKFAKSFCPYLELEYSDIEYMVENQDIRIYYSEYKDIICI